MVGSTQLNYAFIREFDQYFKNLSWFYDRETGSIWEIEFKIQQNWLVKLIATNERSVE